LSLLSNAFGAAVRLRNRLYDSGTLPARRLARPVISVGNLSLGGAGKTPLVLLLGERFEKRGINFDVLSRGYGRSSSQVMIVNPAGSPAEFGDEPLLIARRLRVPVVVGADRYAAGRLAEREFPSRLHLLDDGFQHRALARDFDIVLVMDDDAGDRLLPAGRLREPPAALRRADAVVLSDSAQSAQFPVQGKALWRVCRSILVADVPPRPVAFCGIARPQGFFSQLRAAGVEPAAEAIFRDHHRYREQDVRDLLRLRQRSEAGGFVTTEKDAINLGGFLPALEPLAVMPVRMELQDAEQAVDTILETIAQRRGSPV